MSLLLINILVNTKSFYVLLLVLDRGVSPTSAELAAETSVVLLKDALLCVLNFFFLSLR